MDELLELLDGQRQLISSQAARKSNLLLQHSKTGRGEGKARKKLQLAQGVQAVIHQEDTSSLVHIPAVHI